MEEYIPFVLHSEFFLNVNEAIKKVSVTFYRTYVLHCYNMYDFAKYKIWGNDRVPE